jgi:hypothetical protein
MLNKSSIRVIVLVLLFPLLSAAEVSPELREAMQARLEAVWKKDSATWGRLTADEFTIVVPEGKLQNKTQRLAALIGEKPQAAHPLQREQIQTYGETVLHRFVDLDEWVLEVWVRQRRSVARGSRSGQCREAVTADC